MIGLLFLAVALFGLIINFVRHMLPDRFNRLVFVLSLALVVVVGAKIFSPISLRWLNLFVILAGAYSFEVTGAILVATFAIFSLGLPPTHFHGFLVWASIYVVIAFVFGLSVRWLFRLRERHLRWMERLLLQSKNLQILRDISIALQSTLELDRLIHIILTAITAGYGLGFNRAFLFIASDTRLSVSGLFGIGPMNVQEGHMIWQDVVSSHMRLPDFIELQNQARLQNHELNALLQSMTFSLNDKSTVFYHSLMIERPIIIRAIDPQDPIQRQLAAAFSMQEFAVVPLLNRSKIVGILVIDNLVNKKPITDESLESIMPIVTQAALAIENARVFNQTELIAQTDGLTGLYNQRYFQTMFFNLLDEAKEASQALSLIIADVDFFKIYNDTNGHAAGNEVLQKVAFILRSVIADQGIVCRFGGEEFVILMYGVTKEIAFQYAQQVRIAVASAKFEREEAQPDEHLTMSLGVATFPQDGQHTDELFRAADHALYRAKFLGRNRAVVFQGGD